MLVLALDTATPFVVVGVVDADDMSVHAPESAPSGNRHAETLGALIPKILPAAGLAMADLSAVVVGLGPGPFTGLRVGIMTAAALGDALGIPVYGICSHDAIAASYLARGDLEPAPEDGFAVVTDARRRECYWSGYDGSGARITGPYVQRPTELLATRARKALVLGDPQFSEALGVEIRPAQPDPVGLVLSARSQITGRAPGPLEPMYLRRPDATPPGARKPVTPALT
ncbi:MAG: tRNA (adenosine(37)-N6)-threonylcarbamoyltransferase complex dimerization subunit type 1 TsaB [Actinomycetota bacterium]|nr:tRNA (adenosine(37)-N6)-threonylcarbamoyltransferase complex dimerization subunit type 1 TsaB [Actinomycetota bacterium]